MKRKAATKTRIVRGKTLRKTRSEAAVEKFLAGYNCAQAVLYSFRDDLHLDRDMALRMACGFGGGMGGRQEVCGAVSGGVITIGLKHGRGEGQDKKAADKAYERVWKLMSRFESKHGSCICRTLLKGCDLSTPEGWQHFKEADLRNKICKGCVTTVVETLEAVL
jgi:C_GCAxxG_C_C family probable redox protein